MHMVQVPWQSRHASSNRASSRRWLLAALAAGALGYSLGRARPAAAAGLDSFVVPGEWEPHSACIMAWPWSRKIWAGQLGTVKDEVVSIARAVARFEPVLMVAKSSTAAEARRRCGSAVEIIEIPVDDTWIRDTAAIFASCHVSVGS